MRAGQQCGRSIKGSEGAKVFTPAELLEYRRARGEEVEGHEHEHEVTGAESVTEGSGEEDGHPAMRVRHYGWHS